MEETRIQKWKSYRASLINQEAPISTDNDAIRKIEVKSTEKSNKVSATSTLPIDQVIKGIEEDETEYKESKAPLIIKIVSFSVIGIAIIVGVIFLGIWAYGGR